MKRVLFLTLPVLLLAADPRIARVEAVVESNINLLDLEKVAKKHKDFKKAESLWEQALSFVQSDTKEFVRLAMEASKTYTIAADQGVSLAAFYSQFITNDLFYQTSFDNEMSKANGKILSQRGFCIGYVYLANAYERTGEWGQVEKIAREGLKACKEEFVPVWQISRLQVLEAGANLRLKP